MGPTVRSAGLRRHPRSALDAALAARPALAIECRRLSIAVAPMSGLLGRAGFVGERFHRDDVGRRLLAGVMNSREE